MAPINYLPGMLISDRVFPCNGHTPTPPPPATLTQEQLARDAGQLVQAHAALDKLVSDTDRNANSLLDRIQQVVNCTEGVVEQLVEALKRQQPKGISEQMIDAFHRAAVALSCAGIPGDTLEVDKRVDALIDENKRLRDEAGKDPALDKLVQQAHRMMHDAGVEPRYGTIVERVEALIEDRDRLQRPVGGDLTLQKHVTDAYRMLDKAGIPGGTIDERVRVAIERMQVAKPKPWSVSQCSVMHADGRTITCTSRELAEQTCEMLNRQEAR